MMSDYPIECLEPSRPFINCGVDYAGPLCIKEGRGRGKLSVKSYVAVFVRFATRAVHLELVIDLTSKALLNALKHFISHHGNVMFIPIVQPISPEKNRN